MFHVESYRRHCKQKTTPLPTAQQTTQQTETGHQACCSLSKMTPEQPASHLEHNVTAVFHDCRPDTRLQQLLDHGHHLTVIIIYGCVRLLCTAGISDKWVPYHQQTKLYAAADRKWVLNLRGLNTLSCAEYPMHAHMHVQTALDSRVSLESRAGWQHRGEGSLEGTSLGDALNPG